MLKLHALYISSTTKLSPTQVMEIESIDKQGPERGHAACLGQVSETLDGEGRLVS